MTASGCTVHGSKRPASTASTASTADPSSPKRPCGDAQSTNALLYEWRLDATDREHPLYDTPYIGQVVRGGLTCEQMLEARQREHTNDARRQPKEFGLHWAIRVFGVRAFTVRMLQSRRLPRVQAMEWANAQEIALIAQHGGVMRDCEPSAPMHQTFNLTSGGQGDPSTRWASLQVSSRKKLMKVWPKLKAYYEKNKDLRVPSNDPDLGNIVHHIRSQNCFLWHADFKAWLDEHGFVYDERTTHLEEDVWPKFKAYYEKNKDLRVPTNDPDLGNIVHGIRSKNCFLWHADFKAWLDEHGFVYDERITHLEEDVWPKLKAYYEKNKDLRVPTNDPDLGTIVSGIRSRKAFLWHADFKAWLDEHGFVYDERITHLEEDVWPKLKAYYEKNKHLRVSQSDPDLGNIVRSIRSQKSFLWHADFKAWLDEHGFVDDERTTHLEEDVWPKLKAYYKKNKHLRVPHSDPDLGSIVNTIRSKKSFLWHADFKAWLDEHGFVYDERITHLEDDVWPKFRAYYEKNKDLRVPTNDPDIGSIVHGIRSQKAFLWHADFKAWLDEHGFVYDERMRRLEEGVWPKFKAYYEKNKHLRVPQSDPDLGKIVRDIRSKNCFLWHADFKAWLDEHGFKMHTKDVTKNAERWAAVYAANS